MTTIDVLKATVRERVAAVEKKCDELDRKGVAISAADQKQLDHLQRALKDAVHDVKIAEGGPSFDYRDPYLDALNGAAGTSGWSADGGGPLTAQIKSAGWSPDLPGRVTFDAKAVIASPATANPYRGSGILAPPVDQRYAYANLPMLPLPVGPEGEPVTQVVELVAADPTFADPDDMLLAIAGSTAKPETVVSAALESFDVKMIATISELVPNAIFSLPAFARLVDVTLAGAYRAGLDKYVIDALIAAAGTTDNTGADLFIQLRKAVTNLQNFGFSPTLALVSPTDAEALDLYRATDGEFLLDPAPRSSGFSPLWSLKVIPCVGVTNPIVLDPAAVSLFTGPVQFATNPFEEFSTNQTRARLEGPAVIVPHLPNGIQVVA